MLLNLAERILDAVMHCKCPYRKLALLCGEGPRLGYRYYRLYGLAMFNFHVEFREERGCHSAVNRTSVPRPNPPGRLGMLREHQFVAVTQLMEAQKEALLCAWDPSGLQN